jgi:hypothetical protein
LGKLKTATDDDTRLEVPQSFVENFCTSILNAEEIHRISETAIVRILNKHRYHSYKIKLIQELAKNEFDRRL